MNDDAFIVIKCEHEHKYTFVEYREGCEYEVNIRI